MVRLLILCIASVGVGDAPGDARPLRVASERTSTLPVFSAAGFIQSDASGSLYLRVTRNPTMKGSSIIRLNPEDSSVVVLQPPSRFDAEFREFFVTRAGDVFALFEVANGTSLQMLEYRSDGKSSSPVDLPVQGQVSVRHFAVFQNGTVMLSGFYREKSPEQIRGRSFLRLYDREGRLLKELQHDAPDPDLKTVFSALAPGAVASGEDANLYLLHAARNPSFAISAISPAGETVRKIEVSAIEKDFIPLQAFISDGYLAVISHKPQKGKVNAIEILVIGLTDGEVLGRYVAPEEIGNMVVRFSAKEGFTFLKGTGGVYKFITAQIQ